MSSCSVLFDHAARSSKEIDYEAEVIKSVNTEFEVYKADVLFKSAEAIFEDGYKINTMSELKDILEIGTEHGYLQSEYYRALYEDRGSILTMLFNDYIKDEYTRLIRATKPRNLSVIIASATIRRHYMQTRRCI